MEKLCQEIYEAIVVIQRTVKSQDIEYSKIQDELFKEKTKLLNIESRNQAIESQLKIGQKILSEVLTRKNIIQLKIPMISEQINHFNQILKESLDEVNLLEERNDSVVEDFITKVLNFHLSFGIKEVKFESSENVSKSKNAMQYDLKMRHELINELKSLEAQLEQKKEKYRQLEEENMSKNCEISERLDEALKERDFIADPNNRDDVKQMKRDLAEIEEETTFLMAAIGAYEKENSSQQFQKEKMRQQTLQDNNAVPKVMTVAPTQRFPAYKLTQPVVFTRE